MNKKNRIEILEKLKTKRLFYLMAYLAELNKDGLMDDRSGHLTLQYLKDLGLAVKEMQL